MGGRNMAKMLQTKRFMTENDGFKFAEVGMDEYGA
jgi:hypothetical protein